MAAAIKIVISTIGLPVKIKSKALVQKPARGFSLIEILVVVFIVGIIASMASLVISANDPKEQLVDSAANLTALMTLASEEATLTGEALGLTFVPAVLGESWQYHWQRFRDSEWTQAIEPFQARQFTPDINLSLQVSGQLYDWSQAATPEDAEDEKVQPTLVFYPGGEVLPFILTLASELSPGTEQHIGLSVSGDILWKERPRAN